MSNALGMMIESLVAILLLLTICYCVILNKRLKRLRGDELTLKATISELITATEIAERAIAGLKITVRECDQGLGERLRLAEQYSADIGFQVDAGEKILARLTQIVTAGRPAASDMPAAPQLPAVPQLSAPPRPAASRAPVAPPMPPAPDANAIVQAAQAFATRARTRSRVNGVAA